jgi:hypothetical protein
MKIALTNCWHDDNKGDSGIVWGTIKSENNPQGVQHVKYF